MRPSGATLFFAPHYLPFLSVAEAQPKCIMRHNKIVDQEHADKATNHNYRRYDVPNADQQALHPNVEFINTEQRDYWELATERINAVGITNPRKDAIRIEEIIFTASPEFFKRDANGKAEDYSESQFVKDVMTFAINKYGKENVIGFDLHQDEKSPHIHVMVVPITPDGRLSCKEMFSPTSCSTSQDEFAEAMKSHGLVRGVKYSQAEHQPMQKMYGQQNQTAAELSAQMGAPSSYQPVEVASPGHIQRNPVQWAEEQSQAVNEKARAQVDAANKRADIAQNLAVENASAREQVRVLQKQLSTSEELIEVNYSKGAYDSKEQVRVLQSQLSASEELKEGHYGKLVDAAKRAAGGEPASPALIEQGDKLLDKAVQDVQQSRERVVVLTTEDEQEVKNGDYRRVAEIRYGQGGIQAEETRQKELETDLRAYTGGVKRLDDLDEKRIEKAVQDVRQNRGQLDEMREELRGQGIDLHALAACLKTEPVEKLIKELETSLRGWKGGTERLDQLDAQLAQERTDKAKQQADEVEARAKDEARQKAENERQKPIVRENERQQIEKVCLHILATDPDIHSGLDLGAVLARNGVQARTENGTARLKLKGSEHEFTGADIRPGGKDLDEMINERITINLAQSKRELEKEKEKEKGKDQGQSM